MKKILLAGAAAIAFASSAFAADLPSRKYAPPAPVYVPPAFTWTGFYVGVNAGYSFGSDNKSKFYDVTGAQAGSFKNNREGFVGGAQAGYNYQINQFVIGAEADIQYMDNKKTANVAGANYTGTFKNEGSYFGTVRARLGFTPIDRLLVYGTGGLAYGESKVSGTVTGFDGLGGYAWTGNKSDTRAGYTVGGGVEYAFMPNWTAKVEYLYYDLGKTTATLAGYGLATGSAISVKSENKGNLVRAGLNYKF